MASSLVATGVQFPDNSIQTTAATSEFTSGTVMLFAQTAAPTGWTKNTSTGNNTALRLVTGTASTGGSVAFTTAFASQTPSGSVSVSGSAGNTTLSTPQIPAHRHTVVTRAGLGPYGPRTLATGFTLFASYTAGGTSNVNVDHPGSPSFPGNAMKETGGGGSHNHPLTISSATFSGSAINLAVSYVDVIRATKN
jgi:hypothetical protein